MYIVHVGSNPTPADWQDSLTDKQSSHTRYTKNTFLFIFSDGTATKPRLISASKSNLTKWRKNPSPWWGSKTKSAPRLLIEVNKRAKRHCLNIDQ